MLSTDVWLDAAKRANLRVGERRRFGHSCGPGDVVQVTHAMTGLEAYCFRCNEGAKIRRELSFAEKMQALRQRELATSEFKQCELPSDYTLDIPQEYAVWLYKASIRKAEAQALGIGWSPGLQRIILPVYDDHGKLAFIQARAVKKGQQPKYLNSYGASASKTLFQTQPITRDSDFVVVTEDILSALRCGKFGPAAALCGTSVNDAKALRISRAKVVLCWLDPDPAGQKAMRKFIKSLRVLTRHVYLIHSDKDPKLLSNEEIKQHIERALDGTRNDPTKAPDEARGLDSA